MTTLADVAGYRRVAIGIHQTFLSDLQFVTESLAGAAPARQRDMLLRAFPEVVLPRVVAMQDFAATWSEDLYAEKSSKVRTARAALPAADALEATVRWAVAPAFGETAGTVFGNLGGAGQRYIADAGREIVLGTTPLRNRSSSKSFIQRFAQADACEYCQMLASRGAVYRSEATAEAGSHDLCHCVIAPVFEGDSF